MPNINCCNLNEKQVLDLSKATADELANVIGCPRDWLNYIVKSEKIINENEINNEMCYINIEWFKRSDDIAVKVVNIIDKSLRDLGFKEIVVYFNELEKNNFFENNNRDDI